MLTSAFVDERQENFKMGPQESKNLQWGADQHAPRKSLDLNTRWEWLNVDTGQVHKDHWDRLILDNPTDFPLMGRLVKRNPPVWNGFQIGVRIETLGLNSSRFCPVRKARTKPVQWLPVQEVLSLTDA